MQITSNGWGPVPEGVEVLWRAEGTYRERSFSNFSLNTKGSHYVHLDLYWFKIIKRTPRGAWIQVNHNDKKFILLNARRKWAHETKADALESFRHRKLHQIAILKHQLFVAKEALKSAKKSLTRKNLRALAA
jgi:hypothetical protein